MTGKFVQKWDTVQAKIREQCCLCKSRPAFSGTCRPEYPTFVDWDLVVRRGGKRAYPIWMLLLGTIKITITSHFNNLESWANVNQSHIIQITSDDDSDSSSDEKLILFKPPPKFKIADTYWRWWWWWIFIVLKNMTVFCLSPRSHPASSRSELDSEAYRSTLCVQVAPIWVVPGPDHYVQRRPYP